MGLYERWTGTGDGPGAASKIAVHTFAAALREATRGAVTLPQIVTAFNLDATESAQLTAIADKWTALPTTRQQDAFVTKLHDVMLLAEAGFYPAAKVKAELGFN